MSISLNQLSCSRSHEIDDRINFIKLLISDTFFIKEVDESGGEGVKQHSVISPQWTGSFPKTLLF